MLYEVAIIEKPTEKEKKDGKLEKLLHEPKWFVARDEKNAAMKAAKEFDIDLDNSKIEVILRPFS